MQIEYFELNVELCSIRSLARVKRAYTLDYGSAFEGITAVPLRESDAHALVSLLKELRDDLRSESYAYFVSFGSDMAGFYPIIHANPVLELAADLVSMVYPVVSGEIRTPSGVFAPA